MNKLKILLLCFSLFCSTYLCAQNISGKVEYTATINKELQKDKAYDLIMERILKSAQDVTFELLFTKEESLIKGIDFMQSDFNKGVNLTAVFSGFEYQFYNNLKTNEFLKQTTGPEDKEIYLIQYDKSNFNWTLTNESKQIGKYRCFKAIQNNNAKFPTVAWFTPEIPVGFGPERYQGLPGLILLLENSQVIFTATKVSLFENDKSVAIQKPEGILVSVEEFREKFEGINIFED